MNGSTLNLSTGPVQISKQTLAALSSAPVSHRSKEFQRLYHDTTEYLCKQLNTRRCYLLTGSGTAANEAMIWQIKMLGSKGLILSNGEFGERLINQATRSSLNFGEVKLKWGEQYNLAEVERKIKQDDIAWLLFCHCETSTGMMSDLNGIIEVCNKYNCLCFVDCMSTIGTYPFDLSKVSMATASSGKGLASIPGLAIVFSNMERVSSNELPFYFDLAHYDRKGGIPYTISSNLVNALNVATKQKFHHEQLELIEYYSQCCYSVLNEREVLPFDNSRSKVFTISTTAGVTNDIINKLNKEQVTFSYESDYLRCKNWCQIAFFGYYQKNQLKYFIDVLKRPLVR